MVTLIKTVGKRLFVVPEFACIMRLSALILSCAVINCNGASEATQPAPLGKLIDVGGGHRVHIYCTGQGSPTVVVVSGGFSFDWGLVQPTIAQLTRICTYDPAGTAWSDPLPPDTAPSCTDRVNELHHLLENAGIKGPYVLVGFSIGGLVARLYALRYPDDISGMAIVDHAFIDTQPNLKRAADRPPEMSGVDTPPVLISKTPITLDLEDDHNFSKLPPRDQELHRWALSIHSLRPTPEMAAECFSEVERATDKDSFPLGDKPLAVVSTTYDSPSYRELQRHLLLLSRNSAQFVAENSSHMIIIDEPEVVINAIERVVASVRNQSSLAK
jgi:pimeloyl-ACP methyl ester carboxylesterase